MRVISVNKPVLVCPPKGQILVVDYQEYWLRWAEKALCSEGFEVDIAFDGRQAFRMAVSGVYDVIVMETVLPPYEDGVFFGEEIRKILPYQRILLFTECNFLVSGDLSPLESLVKRKGLEFGVKPSNFDSRVLVTKINDLLKDSPERMAA